VPLVAFVPVQLPEAVHEVTLVEDQVTIEILPEAMLVGLAENATIGEWRRPGNAENRRSKVSNVSGVASAATAGSDTASNPGEASKGESAIIEPSALSGALALRREKTEIERTCITPNPITSCRNPQTITAIMVKICRGSCYSQLSASVPARNPMRCIAAALLFVSICSQPPLVPSPST